MTSTRPTSALLGERNIAALPASPDVRSELGELPRRYPHVCGQLRDVARAFDEPAPPATTDCAEDVDPAVTACHARDERPAVPAGDLWRPPAPGREVVPITGRVGLCGSRNKSSVSVSVEDVAVGADVGVEVRACAMIDLDGDGVTVG